MNVLASDEQSTLCKSTTATPYSSELSRNDCRESIGAVEPGPCTFELLLFPHFSYFLKGRPWNNMYKLKTGSRIFHPPTIGGVILCGTVLMAEHCQRMACTLLTHDSVLFKWQVSHPKRDELLTYPSICIYNIACHLLISLVNSNCLYIKNTLLANKTLLQIEIRNFCWCYFLFDNKAYARKIFLSIFLCKFKYYLLLKRNLAQNVITITWCRHVLP